MTDIFCGFCPSRRSTSWAALANGLSRLRPDKLHRRLLLRVINLNCDKHKRAGGQDDYPMPFLFEREHTNWSSYFNERPFGRMPTYNTERDDTGQLGYRLLCSDQTQGRRSSG